MSPTRLILGELSVVRATVPAMTNRPDTSASNGPSRPRSPFGAPSPYGDDTDREYEEYDDPYEDDYYTQVPRASLPLEPAQTVALGRAIHVALGEQGCDNTLRAAQAWARREKVRWGWLRNVLEDRGGFCDCEVLMNVLEQPD
jgi:hypothetical protein